MQRASLQTYMLALFAGARGQEVVPSFGEQARISGREGFTEEGPITSLGLAIGDVSRFTMEADRQLAGMIPLILFGFSTLQPLRNFRFEHKVMLQRVLIQDAPIPIVGTKFDAALPHTVFVGIASGEG